MSSDGYQTLPTAWRLLGATDMNLSLKGLVTSQYSLNRISTFSANLFKKYALLRLFIYCLISLFLNSDEDE